MKKQEKISENTPPYIQPLTDTEIKCGYVITMPMESYRIWNSREIIAYEKESMLTSYI